METSTEAIPFQQAYVTINEVYTSLHYAIIFHISCNLVSSNNYSQIVEKSETITKKVYISTKKSFYLPHNE